MTTSYGCEARIGIFWTERKTSETVVRSLTSILIPRAELSIAPSRRPHQVASTGTEVAQQGIRATRPPIGGLQVQLRRTELEMGLTTTPFGATGGRFMWKRGSSGCTRIPFGRTGARFLRPRPRSVRTGRAIAATTSPISRQRPY